MNNAAGMAPSFFENFVKMFQDGGPWMWTIAFALAISVGISIERFLRIFRQYSVNGAEFMREIQKFLMANDLDGAIRTCNGAEQAALPKVIKAGLQRASRDEQAIQNAIDATSLEVIPKLERRLPYLALIANLATLLGLLGTISGLIRSFGAISVADPAQKQAILSAGIAEAMSATAFGLAVAVFTMVMHSVLSSRANRVIADIDEHGVKLIDMLTARKVSHTAER